MSNNDHKYSVPVNLLVRSDNPNTIQEAAVITRCYRHLIAPRVQTGLWIRQVIKQSEEYIARIVNRQEADTGEPCSCCMILCGGGYDILVLRNDTPYPEDVENVPKIGISLCLTTQAHNSKENIFDRYGVTEPNDDLYMHMNAAVTSGVFPGNFRIYLQTTNYVPVYQDNDVTKKVILRIEHQAQNLIRISQIDHKDAPKDIFSYRYDPWGVAVFMPQSVLPVHDNTDNEEVVTKEAIKIITKKATPQTSRKRQRADSPTSIHERKRNVDNKVGNTTVPTVKELSTVAVGKPIASDSIYNETKRGTLIGNPVDTDKKITNGKSKDRPKIAILSTTGKKQFRDHGSTATSTTGRSESTAKSKSSKPSVTYKNPKSNEAKDSSKNVGENAGNGVTIDTTTSTTTTNQKLNTSTGSTVGKKVCFYFPFCTMTADICGGTQRGRCREVKSGRVNVSPNIDRKELAKMKREAKQQQQQQQQQIIVPGTTASVEQI